MKTIYTIFIALLFMLSCAGHKVETISAKEFQEKYKTQSEAVLLDLRTSEEISEGMIEGATQLDFHNPEFNDELLELDRSKTYFVYCAAGGRSGRTAQIMRENGFTSVYDLDGGISNWKESGLPVVMNIKDTTGN
ncbi:rhodanese-like domain-containing protein [Reichenbachiella agarivorans]|uniref:Rhodanese-like domain-containing protein n=1 Tax=Reichenbachiella agarivorans TaxID=2979464 RepID=A0ABY6CLH6_9BACT|nr:rhodanese-like domain-containing protein [Reichenbachiella agarivorans]UXP31367.1 rhodanese-like domain-containing protein [Reichenbachiella agarivorans]